MAEVAYGRSCSYLVARAAGTVSGVLPLVWMPGRLSGHRLVSLPYLDMGGPLSDSEETEERLLAAAREHAERLGARSIELRERGGAGGGDPTPGRYRFVLDLGDSSEALWKSIGPKVRNQVRKAERAGVTTERAPVDRLEAFYRVFRRNMRDLGSPVHSIGYLREIFRQFGDDALLYLTADESGRPIAGAIGIGHGHSVTVPWASALRSARSLCPNHSLYWQILEDAVAAGARRFDFGRSSTGTGTFQFKKQWGAEARPLAWRRIDDSGSHPETLSGLSRPQRWLVGVWRRLPLALSNRIGPLVRGRLSQ